MKQHLECLEVDDECIKNLWVKTKGQTNKNPLLWVFAAGDLIRTRKWMRPSTGN